MPLISHSSWCAGNRTLCISMPFCCTCSPLLITVYVWGMFTKVLATHNQDIVERLVVPLPFTTSCVGSQRPTTMWREAMAGIAFQRSENLNLNNNTTCLSLIFPIVVLSHIYHPNN